ncbi:hypothetical protein HPB49_011641 [Dermacentor silvarum]|uniref:Uncharacterized protein n=1 Tax=Dermacentor silvarum TaxID=543639 RepID=A0ACB8D518_DERSI|nr:hypothetical protein HPB49_011641 [Dermacentor silvarum]
MTDAKKPATDKPIQGLSGRKACAAGTVAVLATGAVFLLVGRYVVPSNWQSGYTTASAAAPALSGSADAGSEQRTSPPATNASAACVNSCRGSDGIVGLESAHREVDTDLLVEAIADQAFDEHVLFLAKEPHVAGSPREEQVLAQYVAERLTEYGFDEVQLQPYHVLLSYPNASDPNSVQLLNGTTGEVLLDAAAQEKSVEGVDTDIGPAFHAYSPPGDVLGCLVYVNRATHEDLDEVEALNVSVTGCLCLARHGATTLASKAYTCARKGGVGLLVFPDSGPSDATGSTSTQHLFPSGPEMPESVLRRDTMMKVGDPLTPGVPAIPSAERMDPAFAGLPPIPSQPISYRDAQLLLRSLEGPEAPKHFRLTENVTYRLGDASPDRLVRLRVNNMFTLARINNVIATLRGSIEPDRYVVVGAQRDSFGFGALQPAPNTASLLALGHALGSLKKRNVRPRRSVLLCSWAAGEYGQVGSTEWVEQHLFELHSRAVAYIDISECASGGRLVPKACPSLENLAVEAASRVLHCARCPAVALTGSLVVHPFQVRDPADADKTMYDVWREQRSKSFRNKANLSVRFPWSRSDLCSRWVANLKRDKWRPSPGSRLCSDHFTESCFDRTQARTRLRPDAVPTIFNFPTHLQKVAEHSYAVMETARTLKRKLDCCSASAATVRKRLKLSQQRERRLKVKVQTFSEIINDLRKKQLVSEDASAMLEKCFSGVPVEVMKRLLKKTPTGPRQLEKLYPELREHMLESAADSNHFVRLVKPEVMDAMSDNVPFSLYAGVPSISFLLKPEKSQDSGEVSYPAHHTAYDTLHLYNNWTDSRLAPLCTRLHGAALWLAADAPLIPVNFSAFALRLEESLEELRKSPSALELELNGVSLDALRLAIEHFRRAADQWTAHLTQLNKTRASDLRVINDKMSLAEHTMLKPTGLPGRPLTRHVLWAPSEFDPRQVTGFPVFADLLFYISQLPAETREHGWKNVRFYMADVLVALKASAAVLRVSSP